MAVIDTLQGRDIAVQAYAIFDGVNEIFATWGGVGSPPSAWDAGGGQVSIGGQLYDWNNSLDMQSGFGVVETEVNLRTGTVTSGASSLRFLLPDEDRASGNVWLDLLARSTSRADVDHASLADDFDISDTTLTVHDTTGWPSSGTLYLGLETITYSGKTSTTFTGCTRGRFRSPELNHRGRVASNSEIGSGAYVRSAPLAWKGRVMRLWLCFGEFVDGEFVPFGNSIESGEDLEWYRGIIVDRRVSGDQMYVELEVSTLDQLLAKEVATRLPTAWAGLYGEDAYPEGTIFIDRTCNRVTFTDWSSVDYPKRVDVPLIRDDGGGGSEDVPTGHYPYYLISQYLQFTIDDATSGNYYEVNCAPVTRDGKRVTRVVIGAQFGDTDERAFELLPDAESPNNIWRPMGFQNNSFETQDSGDAFKTWIFLSDRAPARCYIGAPETGVPERIYVSDPTVAGGPTFDGDPGWVDSDGMSVDGYVRVGKECFRFTGYTAGADGQNYLTVAEDGRAQLGSIAQEFYVEQTVFPEDEEREQAVQGIVITNVTAPLAYVQFLTSGSGVSGHNGSLDEGWKGSGANVEEQHVDVDSFSQTGRVLDAIRWDAVAAFEPVKMRDLLPGELAASQAVVVGTNVYDEGSASWSGFVLQAADPLHPMLHEIEGADTLDISEIVAGADVTDEDADDRAVNKILTDTLYDHGEGKFRIKAHPTTHVTFSETYGANPALKIQLKGLFDVADAAERIRDIVQPIFFQFGEPYRVITLPIASFRAWAWGLGKILTLTHPALIRRQAAERGESELTVKVMERGSVVFGPEQGAVFSKIVSIGANVESVGISPAFEVTSQHSGATYNVTAQRFSASETGLEDTEHFRVGEYVRFFEEGDESGAVERYITAIDIANNRVTFNSTLPATAGVCEFVEHDNANATSRQQSYAYMANTDRNPPALDTASSTVPAHRYS